jgi:hypothetical protein
MLYDPRREYMGKVHIKQHSGAARPSALIARASECRRLAEIAEPENREDYLRLARTYDALASETALGGGAAGKPSAPREEPRSDGSEISAPA